MPSAIYASGFTHLRHMQRITPHPWDPAKFSSTDIEYRLGDGYINHQQDLYSDFKQNPYSRVFIRVKGNYRANRLMCDSSPSELANFDIVILFTGNHTALCSVPNFNQPLKPNWQPALVPSEETIHRILDEYYHLHEFTIEEIRGCEDIDNFLYLKPENWEKEGWYDKKEEACIAKIGDKACGGIVFHVDESGKHGLVAAENDLPGAEQDWQRSYLACCNLSLNDYNDWRLPENNELNKIYEAKSFFENMLDWFYWSATSLNKTRAWSQRFCCNGESMAETKNTEIKARPIRTF